LDIFAEWQRGGTEIRWRSTTAANDAKEVAVFSRRCGTPGAPQLVLVHGFPTSSIDYFALAGELSSEFDIYLLDFPGYGLSDKPPEPYVYSLYDDARLLVHAITQVWKLSEYRMLTHDRGSSVGMIALGMLADQDP
jgi:pimeloyl-ACP methyl ester carboxylesterase